MFYLSTFTGGWCGTTTRVQAAGVPLCGGGTACWSWGPAAGSKGEAGLPVTGQRKQVFIQPSSSIYPVDQGKIFSTKASTDEASYSFEKYMVLTPTPPLPNPISFVEFLGT